MRCEACLGTGRIAYTVEDLDKAIAAGGTSRWASDSGGWDRYAYASAEVELDDIGTLRVVEYHDEEFETQCWLVVSITDPDGNERLFKRNGWRASHDGSYLDGPTIEVVKHVETVEVTTYEHITSFKEIP